MNAQTAKANRFAELHVKGQPLVLYNAWDVGSARAVAEAGAQAIATGSWSVAAANGFEDGEKLSLDRVIDVIERIVAAVDLPVTIDFESGYAKGGAQLAANIERVVKTGIVGINFEDRRIAEGGMYSIDEQAARIRTVRSAADSLGVPLFINARTDSFLMNDVATHSKFVDDAIARVKAYANAGGSGLFVPGLRDPELIRRICAESALPVNVLFYPDVPSLQILAELGAARLSYGPRPYREAMAAVAASARAAMNPV